MDEPELNELEKRAVHFLAARLTSDLRPDASALAAGLKITDDEASDVYRHLVARKLIREGPRGDTSKPVLRIDPSVIDISRRLERPADRLSEMQSFLRSHRILAAVALAFVLAAAVVTFLNQCFELAKHVGFHLG